MKKRIISILLSLVLCLSLLPTMAFAKDLSDIKFSGGTSAYIDKLEIDGYVITNCTNQMEGPGWRVDKYALYLSGYDGGGIIAEMKSGYSLNVFVSYDSKITSNTYGIYTNSALTLQAARENTKLEMDFRQFGIYCSGLLTISQGKYILTGRGSNPMVAIIQGHMMIEGLNLYENATVIIDVSGRCNYDLYGIKGLGKVVGGTGGKIGKLLVSVVNSGTGNAYAHDMSAQLTDYLKNNADEFKNEPGLLVVNIPDCTVTVTSTSGGKVSGGGTYAAGKTVTLTATPDEGYIFKTWTNTHDGRGTGLGASITFIATEDIKYTAYFEQDSVTYPITVGSAGNGMANGGGNYRKGETVTITATPDEGYVFDYWTDVYGTKVSGAGATYSFTVKGNSTFTAWFKKAPITALDFTFDIPNDGEEYPDGAKDIGRVTSCPEGVKVVDVETVQYSKRISGTAKAGDLVSFGIIYEVLPGYEIASSYTASINGESAQKVVTGTGVRKISFKNGATIGYNPDIKIQSDLPDTVTYTVGGNIEASVSATGSNLKYQWQLATDSGKKFNTYKDISGATSASLSIKNADASYDGKLLRCCISNGNGNAYSKVATIKKGTANTITAADVTIPAPAAGQKASTYTSWTTDAPEKYTIVGGEWLKGTGLNGAAMGANETFAAGQKYTAGFVIATKPGYTLADSFAATVNGNPAVLYDSGNLNLWYYTFTCPASGAPVITAQPKAVTVKAGESATFTVTATGEKLTYQWYSTDGSKDTKITGATSASYTISKAEAAQNGLSYYCIVTNDKGSVTSDKVKLTVNPSGAPVITAQPKAVTVKAGESATFSVTAEGKDLKYQWYAVDGGVPTKFATTATCTVKNVPLGYNGLNFYCVVSNTKGSVTSDQAKLTVLDPTYKFPFTDVKTTDWFYADVLNANKLGLINGKSATEYRPNDNMTYAEAVKLAACMNQLYIDGAVTLTNGSPNWYDSYYQYCRDKGIISAAGDATNPGYDALYADANKKITREMYVYLFSRCLPASAFPEINKIADNSIPDVPVSMGVWDDGVYLFYRAGILQGSTVKGVEHMFLPNDNIKRSEVAAILSRMMDTNARLSFTM